MPPSHHRRAAELHGQLTPDEQAAARQLFLRLVTVTDRDERTRRRVQAAEILALDVDAVAMQAVISVFGRHRAALLRRGPAHGRAHGRGRAPPLTAWPELRGWISASHNDLRRHAAFTVALREWELAGNDVDYLLSGSRLAEYEQWADHTTIDLTTVEQAFLDASVARRDTDARSEAARRQQEADLGRRARRRLWALVASFVLLAVPAGVLTFRNARRPPTRHGGLLRVPRRQRLRRQRRGRPRPGRPGARHRAARRQPDRGHPHPSSPTSPRLDRT